MAKYNLEAQIISFNDKPMIKSYKEISKEDLISGKEAEVDEYWTLRETLKLTLNHAGDNPNGDDLLKKYDLLMKLKGIEGVVDLTAEEVSFLKEASKKALTNVIILGETHRLLESPVV